MANKIIFILNNLELRKAIELICMFTVILIIVGIFIADIVVDDELCCPSSIENSAKNHSSDFVVRHFLHGCNDGKHPFGYVQS